jgi:hypothetical protein
MISELDILEQFAATSTLVVVSPSETKVWIFSPKSVFGLAMNDDWMPMEQLLNLIKEKDDFNNFLEQKLTIRDHTTRKIILTVTHQLKGESKCVVEGLDGRLTGVPDAILLKFTLLPEFAGNQLKDNSRNMLELAIINDVLVSYTQTQEYHLFLKQVNTILNERFQPYIHFVFNFDEVDFYKDYKLYKELIFDQDSIYRLFEKTEIPSKVDLDFISKIMVFVDVCALVLYKDDMIVKRVAKTESNKMNKIAHSLHDIICQDLASISIEVGNYMYVKEESEELLKIKGDINRIIDEIRSISKNLVPKSLNEYGFLQSIRSLISDLDNESHINFKFETELTEFEPYSKENIYKVIFDLLHFIKVKTFANTILLFLNIEDEILEIKVKEKNSSFITNISADPEFKALKNQIQQLNGQIELNSIPQSGTYYHIKLPL